MDDEGLAATVSPLNALSDAAAIHRITVASALDLFAAHRFLLTLLYWKADAAGGVEKTRKSLLAGKMPKAILAELKSAEDHFHLFDRKAPFLQDPSVIEAKRSSAAYLFSEMSSGTNLAHFDHGDDNTSRLCLCCATSGLVRVVPWMQSGGQGLAPTVHGTPPLMPLAIGESLCETLGLNLIPIDVPQGTARWTGHFRPTKSRVKLLEGLTWNARRIHLLEPHTSGTCSRCGTASVPTVGPIIFEKNDACKKDLKRAWRDPAAFYTLKNGMPLAAITSGDVAVAASGEDVLRLFVRTYGRKVVPAPSSLVVEANPTHRLWCVIVPCTDKAKSYDHRAVWINGFDCAPPPMERGWPKNIPTTAGLGAKDFRRPPPSPGSFALVRAASSLQANDWSVIRDARTIGEDPAAFDIFTGLYWPLRNKHSNMPSRAAAWMALKLMATAGQKRPRLCRQSGAFQPWNELRRSASPVKEKPYPKAIPSGRHLETELREIICRRLAAHPTSEVDWAGLCQFLHEVIR